jgi:hypothetical protein
MMAKWWFPSVGREFPAMMKIAALLAWASGLGFGIPDVYAIWHLLNRGDIAVFMGFPTYGRGPFEDFGLTTTVPLLVLFLLVCAAECAAGWLLWGGRRGGAVLALALLPVEVVFWVGFSLPFGPIAALVRTALILASRSSWRNSRTNP